MAPSTTSFASLVFQKIEGGDGGPPEPADGHFHELLRKRIHSLPVGVLRMPQTHALPFTVKGVALLVSSSCESNSALVSLYSVVSATTHLADHCAAFDAVG